MTFSLFLGCLLTTFSPAVALFVRFIIKKNLRILQFLAGAFIACLSLTVTSFMWFIVPPLRNDWTWILIVSNIVQYLFRFLLLRLYDSLENAGVFIRRDFWIENGIEPNPLSEDYSEFGSKYHKAGHLANEPITHQTHTCDPWFLQYSSELSIASGFSTVNTLVYFGSLLSFSLGPGAYISSTCPGVPMLFVSSIIALTSWFFNIFISIYVFSVAHSINVEQKAVRIKYFFLGFILRLVFSSITLLNTPGGSCIVSIPLSICGSIGLSFVILKLISFLRSSPTSRGLSTQIAMDETTADETDTPSEL